MIKKFFLAALLVSFVCVEATAQEQNLVDSMMFYYSSGNFAKAVFWGEKRVDAIKQKVGDQDTLYGAAISDLGVFYFLSGNYAAAKPLYIKSTEIFKAAYGENNQQYGTLLNNMARLYDVLGEYNVAESVYLKALKIFKEIAGEESADYAKALDNLAVLYTETNKYTQAEKMYLQSLSIRKKVLGEEHPEYAFSLNNLAALYWTAGNYAAAEPLLGKALPIIKKQLGDKHPDYATALGNLSAINTTLENYPKAAGLAEEDVHIKKEILGENNPAYALAIDNLASIYDKTGKDSIAGKLHIEALAIREKTLGKEHPDYAASLLSVGDYYAAKHNYVLADSFYRAALAVRKKVFGEDGPLYLQVLNYQCILYIVSGNYLKADELISTILTKEKKLLTDNLALLSEKELIDYLTQRESSFILPLALLWNYSSPKLLQQTFDISLKGAVAQQNTNSLMSQMTQSKDSLMVKLWEQYKSNKALLNKTLSQPIAERAINADSINTITNQQEKDLLSQSAPYRTMKDRLNVTWRDVRNKLQPNEAAIQFVGFKHQIKKAGREESVFNYAAMLVRPTDSIPVFIKLFEEKELKTAFKSFAYKADFLKREGQKNTKDTVAKNSRRNMYDLVWQPLEPYLTKSTTVYFAPEGLLQEVAFAAIPYKKGTLLCDRYNLVQLNSIGDLTAKESNNKTPSSIALFGGINYNKKNTDTSTVNNAPADYVYQQTSSADTDSFTYLPNTLKEIEGIKKNMMLQHKNVSFYMGDEATEAAFRNLGKTTSPDIIHFATHGFTLHPKAKQTTIGNTFKMSDNPLLRSGLVLAGGNKGWKSKSKPDEDDGILTALEITSVSLANTQLAVLSACETGLGEMNGSEGILGLQRAFKIAGVNYIMASLWQVPDKETAAFMNTFYSNWLAGKTIRKAFIATQQTMRKKYTPYYWAAFTLVQ